MPIPDFQTLMLPLLFALSDQKEHSSKDINTNISDGFKLSDLERKEKLDSGVFIINNRVGWALSYLKKANLIEAPKRAVYKITPLGLKVLDSKPEIINIGFLKKLPAFKEWQETFQNKEEAKSESIELVESANVKTPQELLEFSYTTLREELINNLIDTIKSCSPSFFENLVIDLLLKMGYGGTRKDAGEVTGKSGDGGIDGVIKEDKLGLDTIYIQAKKWDSTVPIASIKEFSGSLNSVNAKKGIFIGTSSYPKSAYEYVKTLPHKIVLIDGKELANLMIEYNVGVILDNVYEVKKINTGYFDEANE